MRLAGFFYCHACVVTIFYIRFTGFCKTAGEYVLEFQVSVIMQEVKQDEQTRMVKA